MNRTLTLNDLSQADSELVRAAQKLMANAYAPYSGFAVGAAVRTRSGAVHAGANVENASYGMTMCAEVSAITAANAAGDYEIETVAIAGEMFSPRGDASIVCTPCGRCRQLIFEASQISGLDIRVLSCTGDLKQIMESRISLLLPHAFGPVNLGLASAWPKMRTELRAQVDKLVSSVPSRKS